eukprot:TRINITY_DN61205_c0_g1_i1.p1 TRINITY_DN61205_c0_g1~~TRINITY_DN61205_c0_g1_i1.p1  ORF type:complete len:692 (+),score=98.01 TRINITY_DN61205_c0_g1_i1:96-2078(+)
MPTRGLRFTPACIGVRIYGLSGRLLEFAADPDSTVEDLKLRIADSLQVPPLCQRLIVDGSILRDADLLVSLPVEHDDNAAPAVEDNSWTSTSEDTGCSAVHAFVSITLIKTVDHVFARATAADVATRRSAAETLEYAANIDHERAIEVLDVCCSDVDQDVRLIAYRTMAHVASPDNDRALGALTRGLDRRDFAERRAALDAVVQVLHRGIDSQPANVTEANAAASSLSSSFSSPSFSSSSLRPCPRALDLAPAATAASLINGNTEVSTKHFARSGNLSVTRSASGLDGVIEASTRGRRSPVATIVDIATSSSSALTACFDTSSDGAAGDDGSVKTDTFSMRSMSGGSSLVRSIPAIVRLVGKMAARDTPHGIAILCACTEHGDDQVRRGIVGLFGEAVPRGNQRALAELRKRIGFTRGRAKQACVEALGQIAAPDDGRAVSTLCGCLDDWDHDVRGAAVEALRYVVKPGNATAINAIAASLESQTKWGRSAAVVALTAVTVSRRVDVQLAVAAAGKRLEHTDKYVRCAAMEALGRLTRRAGDEDLLFDAVTSRLDHPCEHVRRAAARFLVTLSQSGKERPATASAYLQPTAQGSDARALAASGGPATSTNFPATQRPRSPPPPEAPPPLRVERRLQPTRGSSTTPSAALNACGRRLLRAR